MSHSWLQILKHAHPPKFSKDLLLFSQADELGKELKSEDPDPTCERLQALQLELNTSHAAALAEWKARDDQ